MNAIHDLASSYRQLAADLQRGANSCTDDWLRGLWTGEAMAYYRVVEALEAILVAAEQEAA